MPMTAQRRRFVCMNRYFGVEEDLEEHLQLELMPNEQGGGFQFGIGDTTQASGDQPLPTAAAADTAQQVPIADGWGALCGEERPDAPIFGAAEPRGFQF